MPVGSKQEKITVDGEEKDAFSVYFTNGAREQLTELKKHFKQSSELELVKLGISLLQRFKEQNEKDGATE